MNSLSLTWCWCVLQVSAFAVILGLFYLAVRRWRAAAGGVVLASGLIAIAGMSALAYSPWPRWEITDADTNTEITGAENGGTGTSAALAPNGIQTQRYDASAVSGLASWMEGFQESFASQLSKNEAATATSSWSALKIFVALCLLACGVGLTRLLVGLVMVSALRRRGILIADRELSQLVDVLKAELACARDIEILEVAGLGTPATVGWRRPAILLPPVWRKWTAKQRRAILAHEITHIRNSDFLANLIAQIGLVLHFYNPLVHWLAGRLRLEQELNADASAAALSGGRIGYLQTLAAMALRDAEPSSTWPARMFLPTRGHLMRRVEMLKRSKHLSLGLSVVARGMLVVLVAAVCLGITGWRGPQRGLAVAEETQLAQADGAKTAAPVSDHFELSYIPPNTMFVAGVRPASLAAQPSMAKYLENFKESLEPEESFGLSLEEVEQVLFIVLSTGEAKNRADLKSQFKTAFGAMMIRTVRENDFRILIEKMPGLEEKQFAGKTYYKSRPSGVCYFRPDERTILLDLEENMQLFLVRGPDVKADFARADSWQETAKSHLFLAGESMNFKQMITLSPESGFLSVFAPLWEQSKSLVVSASLAENFSLQAHANCENESDAEAVQETTAAAMALLKNYLKGTATPEPAMQRLIETGKELLNQMKVERDGKVVHVTSASAIPSEEMLGTVIVPVVGAAKLGADQKQARMNLKMILLAMHNYHDIHGRFPPAKVLGPDGKTYHSWRVAILPYVDQAELFSQYRLNEPWDSEHNKQLIDKMPPVYSSINDQKNTSYFAIVGPGTMYEDAKGTQLRDVTDGTSNTLMIVEAKREIPWTKPEDIPYNPKKPLPELGGFGWGGILAALADGSVRLIPYQELTEKQLRGLISRNGGEVISIKF